MLKIMRCGMPSGAQEVFLSEILTLCENRKKAFLIVPEQQTVLAEGKFAAALPPSSVLTFEVTNFTRLANTTFRSLGGLSGEYCDSVKKSLIMWRTLTELAPVLTLTEGAKQINSGLVQSALAAVSELQSLGISSSDLAESEAIDAVRDDARLYGKLRDISAIYSLYKKLLSERYSDTGDDAEAMIKRLLENPDFLSDTKIFIEGFTSFTEPQYRLIGILSGRTDVTVALTLPKGREEAFEFSEIVECQHRLTSCARGENAEIKLTRYQSSVSKRKEALTEICLSLWSAIRPNDNISLQNSEDLRIFEAKTPYDECAFVCDDIRRRVSLGASYSDFAIVARSADSYLGILDNALSTAGIPSFTSYRRDVQELEAVKLIYIAYSVMRSFARTDVISYAKCALSGISRDECDMLEMYVNKWQITGGRFTDGVVWNMNPDGYTARRDENTNLRLVKINEIREKLISPLVKFSSASRSASTVREQAEALLDFLLEIEMEKSLKLRAESMLRLGESSISRENGALWQIICDALDTLVTVLGDQPADGEAFLSQLKTVFSAIDIGRIPAYVDRVTVGSADMLRLYEKKHIYLIGVNAGKFPATVSDRSYFTDRDRARLSSLGLAITPELEILGARELYFFSRAFSYATDSVTISFSSTDTRFKAIEPGEVISRIGLLTGGEVKPRRVWEIPLSERLYSPGLAISSLGEMWEDYPAVRRALIDCGYAERLAVAEGDISNGSLRLGSEILKGLRDRPLSLSQSRIDSYMNCPFGYFCRYTIGLGAEERAEFDARSIGTFIHAILENFFSDLAKRGEKSGDLSISERRALTRSAAEKYLASLGEDSLCASVRTKIKIDRLCRAAEPVVDGLCEEFRLSAFEPRFFELRLGYSPDLPDPVKLNSDGGEINIFGIIDRVDAYKRGDDVYLRVVDYKTGKKSFSPEDLSEGSNLQMFLYLKALVESEKAEFLNRVGLGEGGKLVPAGVIYVKTAVSDVKVKLPDDALAEEAAKSAQGREGMILDDPESISAMGLRYTPVYSSSHPDEIRDTKRKFLYDEEGWQSLMEQVEKSVITAADGIRSGEIPAKPKEQKGKSPCEYCEFKPICRKA